MERCGVVAEFNPFHNGHRYFLDAVRAQARPDGIVCVMSGNFVQRGMPAYWDKWTRARAAVACGADLVLELPTVFALGSAREFAFGGVEALRAAGCDGIAFGSETGDAGRLKALAAVRPEESVLKEALAAGLSYPAALARAIGEDLAPNDVLAVEYLRRAQGMEILPVRRQGPGHAESASALRDLLAGAEGRPAAEVLAGHVPEEALAVLSQSPCWDSAADARLFALLRYAILTKTPAELSAVSAVSEGLHNVLKKAAAAASDTDALVRAVKSKRYTYARVTRILMQVLLDITAELADHAEHEAALRFRVLAFSERGAAILRQLSDEKPGVFLANLTQKDVRADRLLALDARASELYAILTGRRVYSSSDLVQTCKPGAGSI